MKRAVAIAVLVPVLAGCATHMKVRPADTRTPAAFEAQSAAAPVAETAIDRWWTLYGDAQLQDLVEQALANSHDAKDAVAKLEQAYFQRKSVLAQTLPTGDLTGSAGPSGTRLLSGATGPGTTLSDQTTDLSASFNVSWELDIFGRARTGRNLAKSDYLSALYGYEAIRTALAANVAQSLFDARGLAIRLSDAEETARINRELERIVSIRVEHGLSPGLELDQAVANGRAADAEVESLQAQLTTARRTLLLLIGRGVDPLASLPIPAEVGSPPAPPAVVPGRLLQRRPDVRQAEFALQGELQRFKLRKLALYPTLNLQPGVTLSQTLGDFDYTQAFWSLAAGLTVPVLDRPKLLAEAGAERAVAEQQVIAYERAVQTAYSEAENALVQLASEGRRVAILTDAVAHAEAAYEKQRMAYSRGYIDLQTALTAENTWRQLHAQLTTAQTIQMQRSVQLFKALGGGWSPDAPGASAPPKIVRRGTK